jgi:hypothetical protein
MILSSRSAEGEVAGCFYLSQSDRFEIATRSGVHHGDTEFTEKENLNKETRKEKEDRGRRMENGNG